MVAPLGLRVCSRLALPPRLPPCPTPPLPFALMAAQHRMGVKRRQMAMVGDQLYADRMAAALYGIPGLMVVPRGPDLGAQVILKRKWEKKHWQKYYDRGGKTL